MKPQDNRVHFVDGLRGWASLVVVIYHAFCDVFPPISFASSDLWHFAPFNGPLAVYIFFILSGFSLAIPFIVQGNREALIRLAAGRYFRLSVPILAAVFIMYLIMVSGAVPPVGQRGGRLDEFVTFAPDLGEAIRFALYGVFFDYSLNTSYITPLWTMSVELIGSLIILAMCFVVGRHNCRWIAYVIVAAAFYGFGGQHILGFKAENYYALFIVGVILAEALHFGWLWRFSKFAILALAIGIALPLVTPPADFHSYFWSAALIVLGVSASPAARQAFSTKASLWLGRMSFSLYLIHLPIFFLAGPFLLSKAAGTTVGIVAVDAVLILLSVAAAAALEPATRLGTTVSRYVGSEALKVYRRLFTERRLRNP